MVSISTFVTFFVFELRTEVDNLSKDFKPSAEQDINQIFRRYELKSNETRSNRAFPLHLLLFVT
jgi:hypothetical protein